MGMGGLGEPRGSPQPGSAGDLLWQCLPRAQCWLLRRLPQLAAAIGLVSEISQQLVERKNEAVSEIGSTFEELETALRQRKGLLVRDLEATCGAKQKVTPPRRCAPTPLCPRTTILHTAMPPCCRAPTLLCPHAAMLLHWLPSPVPAHCPCPALPEKGEHALVVPTVLASPAGAGSRGPGAMPWGPARAVAGVRVPARGPAWR